MARHHLTSIAKCLDLKPGTQLTQTITTTRQERSVDSVRTVDAIVKNVDAPYVVITTSDGVTKRVKVPDGTEFIIDGQSKTVFELKGGMKAKGTIVAHSPETVVSTNTK